MVNYVNHLSENIQEFVQILSMKTKEIIARAIVLMRAIHATLEDAHRYL